MVCFLLMNVREGQEKTNQAASFFGGALRYRIALLWPQAVELWILGALVSFVLIRILGSSVARRLLEQAVRR